MREHRESLLSFAILSKLFLLFRMVSNVFIRTGMFELALEPLSYID